MKKILFTTLVLLSLMTYSQKAITFGIKGGLNYNSNGNYFESIGVNAQNPDKNIGFHLGIFGKFGNNLYFRPELVYTKTKSDYNSETFNMKKLDAPLLLGIKLIGPVSVFGGPSLQYILNTDFEGIEIRDIENDFTVGLNFGLALNLNRIGIDLRYERGLSENEAKFVSNNGLIEPDRLDTRSDQLILSLSLSL